MKRLILFSGTPGTGKSTLSYRLAKTIHATLLTRDAIDRVIEQFEPVNNNLSYTLLLQLAKLNLEQGSSVILDAVFPKEEFRSTAFQIAKTTQTEFFALHCICSDKKLWKKRITERREIVGGWTPADWNEVQRVEEYFEVWKAKYLKIDTVKPLDECLQMINWYIN